MLSSGLNVTERLGGDNEPRREVRRLWLDSKTQGKQKNGYGIIMIRVLYTSWQFEERSHISILFEYHKSAMRSAN